ncbi:MAG: hypothetical protein JNK02_13860 [Planctomycetes bacterium]|nr:hypothetical protein [Planctomycetota bacterium]
MKPASILARAAPVLAAALLLPTLLVAGCADRDGAGSAGPTVLTQEHATAPPFLAAMIDAPERVAHGGLRRIEVHLKVDGLPTSLIYDERVTADGNGRYLIEPVAVSAPSMSLPQREVFEELQRARQGFFFKYRDPRIRDVERFLENYALHVVAEPAVVAGVECVEIEIAPRRGTLRSYRLSVDASTGLVLRALERDATGTVVATTTFLEFTRDPALEGVAFHVERFPGHPLEALAVLPGPPPAAPQVLPAGYREVTSDVVDLAGTSYLRRVYTDGFEHLFFLERRPAAAAPGALQAESTNVTVRIAEVGAFRVAEALRSGGSLFVVGKIAEADVLAVLRSAL